MISTALLPFTGKLGQKFGESRIYTAGFVSYGIGSAACALAAHASVNVLVAARSLEAAGSALLFGVGSALVTRYVPPRTWVFARAHRAPQPRLDPVPNRSL